MINVIKAPERKSKSQQFGEAFSRLALGTSEHLFNQHQGEQENKAIERLTGLNLSGIKDQKMRQSLSENSLKNRGSENERKLVAKRLSGQELTPEERASLSPKVQLDLEKATAPGKKPQASQPIDEDQLNRIKTVRAIPGFEEKSPIKQYEEMIDAGVSKENAHVYADISAKENDLSQKKFDSNYKANEDFINDTTRAIKVYDTETKPKLLQMQKLASDEDLIGPTSAAFLDALGIPLGSLEDPSSELFQKVSLDLLKGLPETYGNKIMKVEVDNFLKTIPTLLNSPEGRRMIASNMLKLGEMKTVFYDEMRRQQKDALEKNKFPRDFQQSVFDQVKPQIDRINNEFVKMSEIKSVPKDHVPFFDPNGNISFVPKEHVQWASENGGRRIW